jgi:YVTN family beta-propeller protein
MLPVLFVVPAGCSMLPPATPDAPEGPTRGAAGVPCQFTAVTTDPGNHDVCYRFDWGDGRRSDWSPLLPPGEPVTMWHVPAEPGRFEVRVQARNAPGVAGGWSPASAVTIDVTTGFPDTVIATIAVGGDPTDIAVRPDGKYLYVANELVPELTVVRARDRQVVARVPCGRCPWMVNASPDGRWVYVSDATDATVTVISTDDHRVAKTVPVGVSPAGACFSPDGSRAYVTSQNSNSVTVLRLPSHTVIATVPVGNTPRDVDILPGGDHLYVANLHDNSLTRVRTADHVTVATIPMPFRVHRVRALPGGEQVYASEYHGSRVAVVSVADDRVIATFESGPGVVGMCHLGAYALAANSTAGTVTIVRPADRAVVGRVAVGAGPWSVHAPADGAFAATCDRRAQTVSVIGYR